MRTRGGVGPHRPAGAGVVPGRAPGAGPPAANPGALHEARRLAAPASVGLADTSLGQEDAASFAPEAAEQLRRVEELVREVVACELLAARQAWWLHRTTGAGPAPAPGLAPLAACLEDLIAPVDRDRPLGPDLDRLIGALERDELPPP